MTKLVIASASADERPLPTPDEAFELYANMRAGGRSLRKLAGICKNAGFKKPAHGTISVWSRNGRWVERAAEFDAKVTSHALDLLANHSATKRAEIATKAADVGEKLLDKLLLLIATIPETVSAGDIKLLCTASIEMIRQSEMLSVDAVSAEDATAGDGATLLPHPAAGDRKAFEAAMGTLAARLERIEAKADDDDVTEH